MRKIPINDCPACAELDILAAEAAGFFRMPYSSMTPPELKDTPATVSKYIYAVEEDDANRKMVWYRHHAAGDSREWGPSKYIQDAWFLVRYLVNHPDNDGASRWYFTMYSTIVEKYAVLFHHSDHKPTSENTRYTLADDECLAITRAFCKAMGMTEVEVADAES